MSAGQSRSELERVLLGQLQPGQEERFVLPESGRLAVARTLAQLRASADPWPEVRRALALKVALETRLGSPSVGAALSSLLRAEPALVDLIRRHLLKARAIDEVRAFQEQEDREEALAAPRHDAPPPPRSVRLASFLDPAGGPRLPKVIRREHPLEGLNDGAGAPECPLGGRSP